MILPPEAHLLVQVLALHFTSPTYQRLSTLLVGALLTTGRRTVANVLRTLRHLAPGHPADYRRVLSRAPWSGAAAELVQVYEPVIRRAVRVRLRDDRLPAYITWDRFEANQARLTANRQLPATPGAVRNGPAVLAGLVRCGRCGRRMAVRYAGPRGRPSYACTRGSADYAEPL